MTTHARPLPSTTEPGHPYVERRGDEAHLVGTAPDVLRIHQGLIDQHDPRWMTVDGDEITLTLTNGTWRYRVFARDPLSRTVDAELVDAQPAA